MMRISIAIVILTVLVAPVLAEEGHGVTLVTKATSGYIFQDLGVVGSKNTGIVTDIAKTRNKWTYAWWQRADATGEPYGHRGFGDEHDLTATYRNRYGNYDFEGSLAFFFIAPFSGYHSGAVQSYVDVGKTINIGKQSWSVSPAVRIIDFAGIEEQPHFTQIRLRLPITMRLSETVQFVIDPAMTRTVAGDTPYRFVFRPTLSIAWTINRSVNLQIDLKDTNRTMSEVDLNLIYHM